MRHQSTATILMGTLLFGGLLAHAQQVNQTSPPTVIRSETKLVLVDAVVTDKKGNYVTDLSQKDFKVFEDNKEKPISSFSYEADPASPNNNQKHYLVLFFDNASVKPGDQMQARSAAEKFVDNNTGPNKFIAVVNFSGTLKIAQNFTNDADRLRQVISKVGLSNVSTDDGGASTGGATLSAASTFGIQSVLMGLRSLAKGLSDTPGRKVLVMLTAGFPMRDETVRSELTATIAACNKSNVSVYPIDVRGLVTGMPSMNPNPSGDPRGRGGRGGNPPLAGLFGALGNGGSSALSLSSFSNSFQARGGTGGSTGGSAGGASGGASGGSTGGSAGGARGGTTGGSTGSTGGTTGGRGVGTSPGTSTGIGGNRGGTTTTGTAGRGGSAPINPTLMNRTPVNPMNNPRMIIPTIGSNVEANQSALYMLAEGTGGFVIVNSNDLLGGMEKIAREQNQYYLIGFTPADSEEGSCHTLHVKLDKGGTTVRSRSGYCNVHQVDVLAGKPAETELESIAAGQVKGNLGSPLQMPFFYTSPNVARVNLAMELPSDAFKFAKVKGKMHSEMNLLGVAYRKDNSVGAKFSDTLKFDFDNNVQVEEFHKKPLHYENQFEVASGDYNMKVVFSTGGENFGKIEKPLVVDPFDGKQFSMSALAFSTEMLTLQPGDDSGLDAVLIEDKVPLVAKLPNESFQVVPAADYHFAASDRVVVYMEIYDPALADEKAPEVGFSVKLVDQKTGEQKVNSGNVSLKNFQRPGSTSVPAIFNVPVKDLPPGSYHAEVTTLDTAGKTATRSADFVLDPAKALGLGWDKK